MMSTVGALVETWHLKRGGDILVEGGRFYDFAV